MLLVTFIPSFVLVNIFNHNPVDLSELLWFLNSQAAVSCPECTQAAKIIEPKVLDVQTFAELVLGEKMLNASTVSMKVSGVVFEGQLLTGDQCAIVQKQNEIWSFKSLDPCIDGPRPSGATFGN